MLFCIHLAHRCSLLIALKDGFTDFQVCFKTTGIKWTFWACFALTHRHISPSPHTDYIYVSLTLKLFIICVFEDTFASVVWSRTFPLTFPPQLSIKPAGTSFTVSVSKVLCFHAFSWFGADSHTHQRSLTIYLLGFNSVYFLLVNTNSVCNIH